MNPIIKTIASGVAGVSIGAIFLLTLFAVAREDSTAIEPTPTPTATWEPSACGDEWTGADGGWQEKQYRPEECDDVFGTVAP